MNTVCEMNIIEENKNLVYKICSKYTNYPDKEDLYQVGIIALINAYKNYNNNSDAKFSTYAFKYIIGEVSKYVRENKSIKISRDLIKLGRKINEYINKYIEVRGFEPSVKNIAQILEIKEEKVISALDSCKCTKSLNEEITTEGKSMTLMDVTPIRETLSNEQKLDLKEAFKYLNSEERLLLINRYFNDKTQNEVAEELGVNQVYVSRLEKKALCKMKTMMI